MDTQARFTTVFILGEGHSGSTLLARLLDRHPDVFCPGELLRLDRALAPEAGPCSCGVQVRQCPTWERWLRHLPAPVTRDYRAWTPAILDQFRRSEARSVLLDSSKSRAYRLSRNWREPSVGYLLILRDPRGVLCSDLRRGADLGKELRTHRKWMQRYEMFATDRPDACLTLYYEDLIAAPESILRRVSGFVGIPYHPAMLDPEPYPHHFVHASTSVLLQGSLRLRLDERWRTELTPGQVGQICDTLGGIPCYARYQLQDS
jgi:hypothetical protein